MKKSIEGLVGKLQEHSAGKLVGGFGSIRGGTSKKIAPSTNPTSCTNSAGTICSGDNSKKCTNAGSCTDTNNPGTCNNSGFCFVG